VPLTINVQGDPGRPAPSTATDVAAVDCLAAASLLVRRRPHEKGANEYDAKVVAMNEDLNQDFFSSQTLLMKDNEELTKELEEANALVASLARDEVRQEQLSKETWSRERRDLVTAIDVQKEENERLRESLSLSWLSASPRNEHEDESYVERDADARSREMIDGASTEREEADESRERVRELKNSDGSASLEDDKEKLAVLLKANVSLTKELEHKTSTLQAVQSVLGGLKVEQANIRETIEKLRVENAELRGTQPTLPSSSPPPPPPLKPKSSSSSLDSSDHISRQLKSSRSSLEGSDSSQIFKLEARIKNIEKENIGMREANATLSAKLFEEMERTDALSVANEGLATRICRLVAYIQQNVDSGGKGAEDVGVGTPTPVRSKSRRGKIFSTPQENKN